MPEELIIPLLAILTAVSSRLVCIPYLCQLQDCSQASLEICESKGQEYRPNSTFCKCCGQCVDYLEDGEKCEVGVLKVSHFIGVPPPLQLRCRPGSNCINQFCTLTF